MKSVEVAVWVTALLSLAIALAVSVVASGTGHVWIVLFAVLVALSYRLAFLAGRSRKSFRLVDTDPNPQYSRLDRLDGLKEENG